MPHQLRCGDGTGGYQGVLLDNVRPPPHTLHFGHSSPLQGSRGILADSSKTVRLAIPAAKRTGHSGWFR